MHPSGVRASRRMPRHDVVGPTVPSLAAAKRPLTQSKVLATVFTSWRLQLCSCSFGCSCGGGFG
eukprot:4049043-Lingulodinium_polyedra.AAC.1